MLGMIFLVLLLVAELPGLFIILMSTAVSHLRSRIHLVEFAFLAARDYSPIEVAPSACIVPIVGLRPSEKVNLSLRYDLIMRIVASDIVGLRTV